MSSRTREQNQARLVRCSAGCGALVWLAGALPVAADTEFVCQSCTAAPNAIDCQHACCDHRTTLGHLHTDPPAACPDCDRLGVVDPAPVIPGGGVALIFDERRRQVLVEGYTVEGDVVHQADGQLAIAAWCYLGDLLDAESDGSVTDEPAEWPWPAGAGGCFWKPTPDYPIRQLVKAGALIAAEIDRRKACNEATS
jgi:hypothetical protein